jgi:hypothetical protein
LIFLVRRNVANEVGLKRMVGSEAIPILTRRKWDERECSWRKTASNEVHANTSPHQTVGAPLVHGSIAILHDENTGLMCVVSEGDICGDGRMISEGWRWGRWWWGRGRPRAPP